MAEHNLEKISSKATYKNHYYIKKVSVRKAKKLLQIKTQLLINIIIESVLRFNNKAAQY